jgi:NADPH:quinone reductase-like Zn-dependent oxidoreductase
LVKPAKIITGIDANGTITSAQLSNQVFSAGQNVWVSTIHCPALFADDKAAAGVDAGQAIGLSEVMVIELFDHQGIRRS